MFLNHLGSSLRREGMVDSAKSVYLLSVEIFENEVALTALVLLLFETKSQGQAQNFAVRYLAFQEAKPEILKYMEGFGNESHHPEVKQNGATMEFMKAVAKGS